MVSIEKTAKKVLNELFLKGFITLFLSVAIPMAPIVWGAFAYFHQQSVDIAVIKEKMVTTDQLKIIIEDKMSPVKENIKTNAERITYLEQHQK